MTCLQLCWSPPPPTAQCLEGSVLEEPACSRNLVGGLAEGFGQQSLLCSEKTAQGTGLNDTELLTSARWLPWVAAPMQKPSQREVFFQQVRVEDGMCLKHKLQPTGDNQTAQGQQTCNSS